MRGESIDELKEREIAEEKAREQRASADDSPSRRDPGWKPSGPEALPGPQQA
jgi:hypothetical protein